VKCETNNDQIPFFKFEKGDKGVVVDNIRKILHPTEGRWSTYALFPNDERATKYWGSKELGKGLLVKLPRETKKNGTTSISIHQGKGIHLRFGTPICAMNYKFIQPDYVALEDVRWDVLDEPCHAQVFNKAISDFESMPDSFRSRMVFPSPIFILVTDYIEAKTERIEVEGTVDQVLCKLYTFYQRVHGRWEKEHRDKHPRDVENYESLDVDVHGWYMEDGLIMNGIHRFESGWKLSVARY
jgi:hypothetical protein